MAQLTTSDRHRFEERCPVPLPAPARSLLNFVNPSRWQDESDEAIAGHITRIRDRVHAIDPWPCLSRFAFLSPRIRKGLSHGIYEDTLANFQQALSVSSTSGAASPLFLDFATGLGQEARALVQDGIPAASIVGADLLPEFIQAGLELFGDGDGSTPNPNGADGKPATFKTLPNLPTSELTWTTCNIFEPSDVLALRAVAAAQGGHGFHTIFLGSFLHCFNLERQRLAVRAIATHLLSAQPGATIVGRHTAIPAGVAPGATEAPPGLRREEFQSTFRHDEESFRRELWDWEIAQRTEAERQSGGGWDVVVHVSTPEETDSALKSDHRSGGLNRTMCFKVTRTAAVV
ncbi:hypothetical protein OC835_006533 [Tilletia horrida]|nr:hypothetical protein OC835_006533 [Tilletia horrida]